MNHLKNCFRCVARKSLKLLEGNCFEVPSHPDIVDMKLQFVYDEDPKYYLMTIFSKNFTLVAYLSALVFSASQLNRELEVSAT